MIRLLLTLLAVGLSIVTAQTVQVPDPDRSDSFVQTSPDKKLTAQGHEIPNPVLVNRRDLDQTRLVISNSEKNCYHGWTLFRLISQMKWSPDSQFLVLTTGSAGGHSPWHYKSFVYCVSDNSFRWIDQGSNICVISPKIQFSGPHSVVLMVVGPKWDIDHPVPRTINLEKESREMEKVKCPEESGKLH